MNKINILIIPLTFFFLTLGTESLLPQNLPKWAIIFGADKTISEAQHEVNRFNGKQVDLPKYRNKAAIFRRENWQFPWRSLLLFNTESEARQSLQEIETYINQKDPRGKRGSYVVNLGTWCPNWYKNPSTSSGLTYFQCK